MKTKTLWIVQTGVFLALLIVLQWLTKPLGTLVTGSVVNFLLIAATLIGGIWSGVTIGVVSPFLALLLGIVPMPVYFVPVVAIGNAILVAAYALILRKSAGKKTGVMLLIWIAAIVAGSVMKFIALYAGVNWLVVPLVTTATGAAVAAPAAIFSTQQMLTAAIGGALALAIVPAVMKALNKGKV